MTTTIASDFITLEQQLDFQQLRLLDFKNSKEGVSSILIQAATEIINTTRNYLHENSVVLLSFLKDNQPI